MLIKWFKGKVVPNNGGNSAPSDVDRLDYVKVFELELSNMEGTPVYSLTHQITIGSEIGNIIISDPSVSPRHATFVLQEEVVSLIDHGSVRGTFVNGQRIDPGKYIILEESDVVQIGDLEVRLRVGRAAVKATEIPAIPSAEEIEEAPPEELPVEELPSEEVKEVKKAPSPVLQARPKTVAKKRPIALHPSTHSANAVIRLFAVISDFFIAYALLVVLLPFDEFRNFVDSVPGLIASFLDVDVASLWSGLVQEGSFVARMLEDAYSFFSSTFHFGPLFLMFVLNRLLTTFVFGVSFSELMLGIRPTGNLLWARVGGVLRVLVGVFTFPFLVFDVPAIVSRRTFKEVVTFTKIQAPSAFVSILGILLYFPLTIAFALLAPLVQGLEAPEAIVVNDRIEQRVRVKLNEEGTGVTGTEASLIKDRTEVLNFSLSYDPNELTIIPNFKFEGVKSKLNVKNSIIFYQRDLQNQVEMEVFKTFDLKQLLGIGFRGNVFLYDKYPQIYNFVYESEEKNPAFRKVGDRNADTAFTNEFIQFTKMALALDLDNALEVIQSETPLIKGLLDYKSSFLALIEYKEFDEIGFIKLGDVLFMKISFVKQRPFDLIIPLVKGEGRIFKVTYGKRENLNTVSSRFYKFNLEKLNWTEEGDSLRESGEVMTALEVFDFFSSPDFKTIISSGEKAQSLYAYYFETSGSVLQKGDPVEIEIWKNKVGNLVKLLEAVPAEQDSAGEVKSKLLQNFGDLLDAIEGRNIDYFGISSIRAV